MTTPIQGAHKLTIIDTIAIAADLSEYQWQ